MADPAGVPAPLDAVADPAPLADDPALDRMIFGRILDLAANDPLRSLPQALALTKKELATLAARHAPGHAPAVAALPDAAADTGEEAIEEADLRAYIAEHGARGSTEERWLAAVLARRSLEPNHLWQDMGFHDRGELNAMFRRHFPALVAQNANDMKWKKFFYRQLCEREGMMLCKSPNCDVCEDVTLCFEEESGDPLNALARLANGKAA
ncbi:nitrogen fixation protein NifQ [Azospirillum doebereinerae]|uniref:Nitrogen fixation protein NifQ n=1 Tax=Azospirillum doebereinerae TaxID=92933 RepID=A0A433JBU5_9PROT|nr:nitrogen fixation protein NifQ [Azospirillum doebereinerae]MCG5242576.1 nitrogen fixation protein NifQ [Azospirillum doebereinerae]RUQ74072.1 nitrogen fixation protein NifQ [Azospirillum doebereinerae]